MDIVIIEDELLLADELQERLQVLCPNCIILAKLHSVEEAVDWFSHNDCDLIFMDIQLSDGVSFSIFEQVNINAPIIFTTAYDHYTLQAFDVNGIAYLLKPIDEGDLRKALDKYEVLRNSFRDSIDKLLSNIKDTSDSGYKSQMLLTQGQSKILIEVGSIIYFHAEDRYVFAFIDSGRRLFCNYTLRDLETLLNPDIFFRISRAFIVNRANIVGCKPYSKGSLKLLLNIEPPIALIVSRSRINEFKEWLQS